MNSDETLLRYSRFRLLPSTVTQALLKARELAGISLGLAFVDFLENHGTLGKALIDRRLGLADAAADRPSGAEAQWL